MLAAGNRMKVLARSGIGVWLAARRLNSGRSVWPRYVGSTLTLSRSRFDSLVLGLPPVGHFDGPLKLQDARTHRFGYAFPGTICQQTPDWGIGLNSSMTETVTRNRFEIIAEARQERLALSPRVQAMQQSQEHVSTPGPVGILADLVLCFFAALMAVATVSSTYASGALPAPEMLTTTLYACGFALVMALMYAFAGLYRPKPIGWGAWLGRSVVAAAIGTFVTYVLLGAVANSQFAETVMMSALGYVLVGLVTVRLALHVLQLWTPVSRVLIVGTGPEAISVASDMRSLKIGRREIVGFYPSRGDSHPRAGETLGSKVFDLKQTIDEVVRVNRVGEIIVAVREQRGGSVSVQELLTCRIQGVPVLDLAAFYERSRSEVPIDSLKASWLVYGHGFVQGSMRRVVKRVFDIISSGVLLLLASPVMVMAAIAIKLDSPGKVLYRQERVGLAGRKFMCVKFRSMRSDAERDGVARWATKNDSRVTRVGSFLRRTRIDELPQLFSVLRGEMSMVGPRPERPSFVEQLRGQIPFYDIRHSVKPGLTGWAQVRYAYGASVEDARKKHQLDLYYVKNNSLILDLIVLVETVSVVLFREGQEAA